MEPAPVKREVGKPLRVYYREVRASEYDDDGFLGIQTDGDGDAPGTQHEPLVPPYEALHPYGHAGRPLDPELDPNGEVIRSGGVLELEEGSESFTVALGDSRVAPVLATLQKGESLQYGPAGNFVRCHADGRVSRFSTHDGTVNGRSLSDTLGPDGYERAQPWSVFRDDKTGLHYRHMSGARLDLGFVGGLPAPFDAFSTYAKLTAHSTAIESSAIQLGAGAGAQPVAMATTTLATFNSVSLALQGVAAALSALGSIAANNAAQAAIGAAVTAVTAASTAIGSAALTLPSRTTTVT